MKRVNGSMITALCFLTSISAAAASAAALPFTATAPAPVAAGAIIDVAGTAAAPNARDGNRQADETRRQQAAEARRQQQADGARRQQAADARRQQQADEARRQQAAEARRQQQAAEARRQQQADEARRQQAAEARRQQQAAEARRQQQADEARRQQAAEARRQQQAAEARRQQQADEARRQQAAEARRQQQAAEARRQQQTDEARRRQVENARRQQQTDAQRRQATDAAHQRQLDDARRRQAAEDARRQRGAAQAPAQRLPLPVSSTNPDRDRRGGTDRPAAPANAGAITPDRPGTGQSFMEAPRRAPRLDLQPGGARNAQPATLAPNGPGSWSDHAAAGIGTSASGRQVRPLIAPPPQAPLPGDPPSPSAPPIVVPPAPMVGGPTIVQINQPIYNFNSWTCAPAAIICPNVIILPRRHSFLWTYRSAYVSRAWWHDPWCDPYYGWGWAGSHWRTRFAFSISGGSWAFGGGHYDPFWRPFRTHAFGDPWCRPVTWRPARYHRIAYLPYRSYSSLWLHCDWYSTRSWYAPSTYAVTSWDRGSIATLVPPMPAPLAYITADGWDRLRDGDIVAAHDIFQAIYLRDSWDLEAGFGLVVTSWFWDEGDAAVRLLQEILASDVGIVDRIPTDPMIQYQLRRLIEDLEPRAIADPGEYGAMLTIAALEAAMSETLRAYFYADQALRSGADQGAAFTLKDHVGLSLRR